jgi:hypothetical protein
VRQSGSDNYWQGRDANSNRRQVTEVYKFIHDQTADTWIWLGEPGALLTQQELSLSPAYPAPTDGMRGTAEKLKLWTPPTRQHVRLGQTVMQLQPNTKTCHPISPRCTDGLSFPPVLVLTLDSWVAWLINNYTYTLIL